MQRSHARGWRLPASILASTLALATAVPGCDPGPPPAEQAKAGQQAAQSSMDYMRKRIGERKGASAVKTSPGRR